MVLIWLGTCEITQKKEKYIKSLDYPYQNIEFILTEYRKLKLRIKLANPQAVILFIECPYYSISRANKHHSIDNNNNGKRSLVINKVKDSRKVQWATQIDKNITQQVNYVNDHLKLLNKTVTCPRISQDLIRTNKKTSDPCPSYKVNYNLLTDGLHPGKIILKLWIYKLILLVMEVTDWC